MGDCTYTVPDLSASGDALYGPRICWQPFVDFAWKTHGFNNTYWQDGWGFDDPCNVRKPVARVLSAMWLLTYSADDYRNDDWSGDMLHWGPRYVREQFGFYGDLRASCGNSPVALTTGCQQSRKFDEWKCQQGHEERKRECRSWTWVFAWLCFLWSEIVRFVCQAWGWVTTVVCSAWYGTVGGGERVTLYLPFFYPLDGSGLANVVERAGTLVHEARHIGAKPHDDQFPAGSIYGAGADGADSSWGYEGAWMYNALYLWWFYAAGTRTSLAMKQAAKQKANSILVNAFAQSPGFLIA